MEKIHELMSVDEAYQSSENDIRALASSSHVM